MYQKITQLNLLKNTYRLALALFVMVSFSTNVLAQVFNNGALISNSTSASGVAAPAGFNWSECQNVTGNTTVANSVAGSSAGVGSAFSVADNFTVPAGPSWVVNKITVYAYSTGAPATPSPFTDLRVRVHNSSPLAGPTTILFGDLTTNRLTATSSTNVYRIFNTLVPPTATGTTRLIWRLEANVTGLTLAPGTYWLEFQTGTALASNFVPLSAPFGVRTVAGYNAIQSNAGVWAAITDAGVNQAGTTAAAPVAVDIPFAISYATGPCSGTPTPGNTISSVTTGCPGTSFNLTLQNPTLGTGLIYQWQSGPSAAGPFTNITGATSSTYSGTINSTQFYQATVNCSGNIGTSTPVQVSLTPPSACYCASGATSTADEEIFNVTFGGINNSSTCTTLAPGAGSVVTSYSNYTGYTGAPVGTVLTGLTSAFSVQIGTCGGNFSNSVGVWIDYNQNGTFEITERAYLSPATTVGPHTETANILIPVTALPGITRMRVINVETAPANITACGTYLWGETEDYNINVVVPVPCAGTPAPGNTISTVPTVCPTVQGFTLSLQNNPPVSGLTYQWFRGPSATGPFTAVVGATNNTLNVANIAAATFYYCTVTCATGGATANSSTLGVGLSPTNQCYCASGATSTADEEILNVTLGTLNNTSTCTTLAPGPGSIQNRYSNYTTYATAPTPPNVEAGSTVPFSVAIGTCGGNFTNSTAIWIDANQDGAFTANERLYVSPVGVVGPNIVSGTMTIPGNAVVGVTRMRVVNVETGAPLTINACGTYLWGETEDYNVNITPCIPVTITAQPASVIATCGSSTTISVAVTGTAPTFQWQFRTSPTAPWNTVPAAAPYSGTTSNALVINPVATSLNGYQYRAIVAGGCTATDFTSVATLTVAPIVATVTPTAATFCLGGTQQFTITNIASPTLVSQTFNSGVLALPIADGNLTGVNNTIAVSGIPAGAQVTNVTVTVNVPHTYVSDLMVVVRGPNNQILNLSNLIGGGNNPGANFTNTAFSSTATAALNTGVAPGFTGTFRPDGAGAVGAFGVPGGPTGFTPTLPGGSLSAFHALTNGNWTIAMYDAGPPDVGTLIGWSVKIDYLLGSPATGVFSGPAGTIFTNAAATTPYTGTPINSVFVKPTTGGVNAYSVVVTDAACSSNSLTIPVTVNVPVAGTATLPATTTVCSGRNATITLGGALTGPTAFNHQYQVQLPGSTTWSNVANGANYSGATTSALTIISAPNSFNGYRYRDSISAAGSCGSLISNATTLTVNPSPVVTISAAPVTKLFPGLTTTLTAASSPSAVTSYQWFRDGVAVANATTNRLVVNIDGLGRYTVAVGDANGCSTAAGSSTPASINITDSVNTSRLFIYPSPNTGQFQVRHFTVIGDGSPVPAAVNVYDEKGSLVFNQAYKVGNGYQPMTVTLSPSHGRGIYRVDLVDTRGGRIKTGSVIIF